MDELLEGYEIHIHTSLLKKPSRAKIDVVKFLSQVSLGPP